MHVLRTIGHSLRRGLDSVVSGLTAAFDRLTPVVARLSDRCEAHLAQRTTLLRAHYRRDKPQPLDLPFTRL